MSMSDGACTDVFMVTSAGYSIYYRVEVIESECMDVPYELCSLCQLESHRLTDSTFIYVKTMLLSYHPLDWYSTDCSVSDHSSL